MNKLNNLKALYEQYGDKPISEIINEIKGENKFECPECKGEGQITITYIGYPSGLPDSGYGCEEKHMQVKCNLCKGLGYTKYELEPHYIQDGWQIKNRDNLLKIHQDKINEIKNNVDYYGQYSSVALIEQEEKEIELFTKVFPLNKK